MSLAEVRWIDLPSATDERGILTAVEGTKDIPFPISRIFYMHGTPAGIERGGHAHRDTSQVVIPIAGHFRVDVSDGAVSRSFELLDPRKGLFVPPMIWVRLYEFSSVAVALVLADTHYDRSRSLRTWVDFLSATAQLKHNCS
jgi:hypothetical protein